MRIKTETLISDDFPVNTPNYSLQMGRNLKLVCSVTVDDDGYVNGPLQKDSLYLVSAPCSVRRPTISRSYHRRTSSCVINEKHKVSKNFFCE